MNQWQMLKREKKARAYAEHFRDNGVTAAEAPEILKMTPDWWRCVADILNLRPPSEATKRMIQEMLREK